MPPKIERFFKLQKRKRSQRSQRSQRKFRKPRKPSKISRPLPRHHHHHHLNHRKKSTPTHLRKFKFRAILINHFAFNFGSKYFKLYYRVAVYILPKRCDLLNRKERSFFTLILTKSKSNLCGRR